MDHQKKKPEYDIEDYAVMCIFSRIRPNESGEVQVTVDGTLRTLTARAKDRTLHIPTGEFITVLDFIGSTLIVEPLDILEGKEEE